MEKQIPLVYKVLLRKFWSDSEFGKLGFRQARIILNYQFRLGKQNSVNILKAMQQEEYLQFRGPHTIKILVPIKDLV